MGVFLEFRCGGCDAVAPATRALQAPFISVSGKSYGIGSHQIEPIKNVFPAGWMPFDPYTGCCYCPECWKDIEQQ